MGNNYFDFLSQNAPSDIPVNDNSNNLVNLTVRADAECTVNCDGDFLFLLEPGKIQKEKVPIGQHILEFVSTDNPDVKIEKVVDYSELGKNYVLLISELKDAIVKAKEEKKKEEAERIYTIRISDHTGKSGEYTGHLSSGKPIGKGSFKRDDGAYYEGEYLNGNKHGKGIMTFANGEKYEGEWADDKRNGKGIYLWADGDKYEGDFVDGSFNGKGVYLWADGRKYEGEWADDKKNGKGIMTYANGDILEGLWINDEIADKPHIYIWANGNKLECDGWDGGSKGNGVMTYINGDRYEGNILNGYRSGHGSMFYANGIRVEGEWEDDKPQGNMIVTYADGTQKDVFMHTDESLDIYIKDTTTFIDGFEAVDLGLSVRWASLNLGAKRPEEPGYYYAWGETESKSIFKLENYKFIKKLRCFSEDEDRLANPVACDYSDYNGEEYLHLVDDAAFSERGTYWRLPNSEEWRELCDECNWDIVHANGMECWKITGKNGRSIIIPRVNIKNDAPILKRLNFGKNQLFCTWLSDSVNSFQASSGMGDGYQQSDMCFLYKTVGLPIRPVYKD